MGGRAKTVRGWNGRLHKNENRGREAHELEKFKIGAGLQEQRGDTGTEGAWRPAVPWCADRHHR